MGCVRCNREEAIGSYAMGVACLQAVAPKLLSCNIQHPWRYQPENSSPELHPVETLQEILTPEVDFIATTGMRKPVIKFKHVFEMWLDDMANISGIPDTQLDLKTWSQPQTNPFPPHRPRLTQPERQIWETGYPVGTKILMPHLGGGNIPRHLQINDVRYKANCTPHEAWQIIEAAKVLDADTKIMDKLCRWAKKKGAIELLAYLYTFVVAILDMEESETEEIKVPEKSIFGEVSQNKLTEFYNNLDDEDPDWDPEIPEKKDSGSYISYHVLEDFNEPEVISWFETQPRWFRDRIELVKLCNTKQLAKLGKAIHSKNGMNRHQAGVFWTQYRSRKVALTLKPELRPIALNWLNRIAKCNGKIGRIGFDLYNLQHSDLGEKITIYEWSAIWESYKEKRASSKPEVVPVFVDEDCPEPTVEDLVAFETEDYSY